MLIRNWPGARILVALAVLVSGGAYAGQAASPPAAVEGDSAVQPVTPLLEPKAVNLLKAASARLASARSMRFTAIVSYESPSRLGQPLVYTTRSEVLLQRPDKLRVITPGDGPASEIYYDGGTFIMFSPEENFVSIDDGAPPTIDAALEQAYREAAIYLPFTDMIVADPWKDIAGGLTLAFYIGQSSVVGGTTTDMLAYETDGTFIQLWIGADDKLPRMARAVFRNDPLQLRHQVEFSGWQLDIDVPAGAFALEKAGSATPIPFARPDAEPVPPGSPAPAGGASSGN